jgi:hypothetical protein
MASLSSLKLSCMAAQTRSIPSGNLLNRNRLTYAGEILDNLIN